ncbi:hypothetical protein GCM10022386_02330 [Flavobacterium cheonhonense]|uniref:Glycosyltransferase RgtA/B/C/D-like domain-containing protein n=1 Tax=Flavobacterium cheonhonense TaxID=706185 RepID=A0ABP7T965_9FLAO|nr:hypothetical protein [Flavobacterium cheonhonense]
MLTFIQKYRYSLLLVLIGLLWLEVLNVLLQLDRQTLLYPDASNYLESAQKMYLKFTGHYYRPMVMAFITGLPYLFGSSDAGILQWSLIVNVMCWLGTSLLLFQIAKDFLKTKVAFIVAILPFFIIGNAVLNYHLLTENIYTFFIVLAFYSLFRYFKTNNFWFLSFSLSLLLSSMLIKPGAKFLAILILLFFIKTLLKNHKAKAMILIYGSVLMILIQLVGMKVQYGDFTISYIDGVTYHNYLFSKAECFKNGKEYHQINNPRAEYLFSLLFTDQKRVAKEDAILQIKTNFPNVVKAYFDNLLENTKSGNACVFDLENKRGSSNFTFWKTVAFNLSKWQNRLFTVLGVLVSLYFVRKLFIPKSVYALMALFVLYTIILSGISCGQGDRFHVITFPIVFLLLAKALIETDRFKRFFVRLQK